VVYLLKGELKLDQADGCKRLLVGGCDDALRPVVNGAAYPVGAKAITDVELLWFDNAAMDILMTWDQSLRHGTGPQLNSGPDWRSMAGIFDARKLTQGVFSHLPAAHIDSLLSSFEPLPVRRGEVVIRQGDLGDYYYVIGRGRAQVIREVAGAIVTLAELHAGDVFGEEALIADAGRNATVTMLTDGDLLRLNHADFIRLLREPLLQKLSRTEAENLVARGAQWLDVRFPAEFRVDGLPGAINVPLNELRDAIPRLKPETEYVVYCQTGRRSSAAAFLMCQRGLHASLLAGGLTQWAANDGATA
jgi:rhodanese-related sulfurtransferase